MSFSEKTRGLPHQPKRLRNFRDNSLHLDAGVLRGKVREFMAAHPGVTQQWLSQDAGLGKDYVCKLLCGNGLEVSAEKGRQLLAAMRRVERGR